MRETLTVGVGVAILVFPLIILITAAIGRGYCSSICPLGTLQDVVFALSRKFIKVRLHFRTPRSMLRAAILALVVTCWAAGSTIPLALLEPFSIVARVVSLTRGSPTSVRSLPVPGGNSPELFTAAAAPVAAAVLSMAVLVSVLFVAAAKGRLFCNTLCPVGALLSLPGSYSILRIRMARERCTACGLCERVCPARCIDVKTAHIYAGSCTLCFSCLAACPTGALRYGASEEAS